MKALILTLTAAWAGYKAAARLRLPAPAMLGSMLAVGLTNILFDYASLPGFIKVVAQAVSGAFIGMQISKKDMLNFRFLVGPFLLLAALLIVLTNFAPKKVTGLHPIVFIGLSAVVGVAFGFAGA